MNAYEWSFVIALYVVLFVVQMRNDKGKTEALARKEAWEAEEANRRRKEELERQRLEREAFNRLSVDELVIEMQVAEEKHDYDRYNRCSDRLRQLGDPRCQYIYENHWFLSYSVHLLEDGEMCQNEEHLANWEKLERVAAR